MLLTKPATAKRNGGHTVEWFSSPVTFRFVRFDRLLKQF
jgi:hypothetical protein